MNTPAETTTGRLEKNKRPYSKPSLQAYGGVLELTQDHSHGGGSPDGGTTPSTITKTN